MLWEFPGGKLAPGESSRGALVREFSEELGVVVKDLNYLTQVVHDYSDFTVALDVWLVESYEGAPKGAEGQLLSWFDFDEIKKVAIPPANSKVLQALMGV